MARVIAEREQSTLQVVVETANRCAAVLPAKLDGVASFQPGEVVKNLETLAGAAARNTESTGAQVLKNGPKVNFRQSKFARAHVERNCGIAKAGRIDSGIERRKRRSIPAVTETDFVDFGLAQCGQ